MEHEQARREFLKLGTTGLAVAGLVGATAATLAPEQAAAQAAAGSTAAHGARPRQADRRHRQHQRALALREREGRARRHGHHHGADPRQGPVRRREQGRVRPPGSGPAHPEHHDRQGRHRHPVHDGDARARAARRLHASLLRRGHRAPDPARRAEQELRPAPRRRRASTQGVDPAERRCRALGAPGAAAGAGDADRHAGERHPGARIAARRCGGGRPVDRALARRPQPEPLRRLRARSGTACSTAPRPAGRPGLAEFRQHDLQRRHVRPPERPLRRGLQGIFRPRRAGAARPASRRSDLAGAALPSGSAGASPRTDDGLHAQLQPDLAAFRQALGRPAPQPRTRGPGDRDRGRDRARARDRARVAAGGSCGP